MHSPLVSIIVPIYNVEPYLRRCLDSIINQTYTNLEIILVDDGSPDKCPQICDEYAAKDKRIIVLHKENGGLSDARNAGLNACKGDFISFVDSDDWIADIYTEFLLKAITQNNAEIATANLLRTTQQIKINISAYNEVCSEILQPVQAVKKLWSEDVLSFITVCGTLYKQNLFTDLKFPQNRINEDIYISYKLLYASKKTVFLHLPIYCYFQRPDSISSIYPDNPIRTLCPRYERYLFFKKKKETELMTLSLKNFYWDMISMYKNFLSTKKLPIGFLDEKNFFKNMVKASKDYYSFCHPHFHQKVFLVFLIHFPFVFKLYQKILSQYSQT